MDSPPNTKLGLLNLSDDEDNEEKKGEPPKVQAEDDTGDMTSQQDQDADQTESGGISGNKNHQPGHDVKHDAPDIKNNEEKEGEQPHAQAEDDTVDTTSQQDEDKVGMSVDEMKEIMSALNNTALAVSHGVWYAVRDVDDLTKAIDYSGHGNKLVLVVLCEKHSTLFDFEIIDSKEMCKSLNQYNSDLRGEDGYQFDPDVDKNCIGIEKYLLSALRGVLPSIGHNPEYKIEANIRKCHQQISYDDCGWVMVMVAWSFLYSQNPEFLGGPKCNGQSFRQLIRGEMYKKDEKGKKVPPFESPVPDAYYMQESGAFPEIPGILRTFMYEVDFEIDINQPSIRSYHLKNMFTDKVTNFEMEQQ